VAAFNHYLANARDRVRTVRRGGAAVIFSLDHSLAEDWYGKEPADPVTPERLYERRWARTVLEHVLEKLRLEYEGAEKSGLFEELKGFLAEKKAGDRAEIAARHGIGINAVDVSIHRLRRRYGELLREEIAQTVGRNEEIDDEIRYLIAIVAEGSPTV